MLKRQQSAAASNSVLRIWEGVSVTTHVRPPSPRTEARQGDKRSIEHKGLICHQVNTHSHGEIDQQAIPVTNPDLSRGTQVNHSPTNGRQFKPKNPIVRARPGAAPSRGRSGMEPRTKRKTRRRGRSGSSEGGQPRSGAQARAHGEQRGVTNRATEHEAAARPGRREKRAAAALPR